MMQYINPYELLKIKADNLSEVSSLTINKAKRKLFAEIELSDTNTIWLLGIEINKGDCIRAINDLDDNNINAFHFTIYQNKPLERFLTNGDLSFFYNFRNENIFALPEFLDFISPFYSEIYNKVLSESFKESNFDLVEKLLSITLFVNESYIESCYRSTYAILKALENDIEKIIEEIKTSKSPFLKKNFEGLYDAILEKVDVHLLNLLPSYFQNLRNKVAMSIRNLAVVINNSDGELFELAYEIIEIAYYISTDSIAMYKIDKDYDIILSNFDSSYEKLQSQEKATNELIGNEWKDKANQIEVITKEIVDGESKFISSDFFSLDSLLYQIVDPSKLNTLTDNFQSVRNYIGAKIRTLAITLNNAPYHKYTLAYEIISIANSLKIDGKVKENVSNTYQVLKRNFEKQINNQLIISKSKVKNDLVRLEEEKQALLQKQTISEWTDKITQIEAIKKEIADGVSKFISSDFYALDSLINQIVDPSKLNSLSDNFQSIRNKVAAKVGSLAVTVNNEPHINYKVAYDIISIAYSLKLDGDIAENVSSTYQMLKINFDKHLGQQQTNLKSKSKTSFKPKAEKKNPDAKKKNRVILGRILLLILLIVSLTFWGRLISQNEKTLSNTSTRKVTIRSFRVNGTVVNIPASKVSDFLATHPDVEEVISFRVEEDTIHIPIRKVDDFRKKYTDLRPTQNYKLNTTTDQVTSTIIKPNAITDLGTTKPLTNPTPDPPKSSYYFPYIANGNLTGCQNIRERYNKKLNNKLVISCGSNADVAVKMIDNTTDKCIRYVYIHKNSTFTIRNIPEGTYYLKIAYGNDWGLKAGESNGAGRFTSNSVCEKGVDILTYNLTYKADGSYSVPSYSLKLNVIYGNDENMNSFSTNNISENDFYDN